MVLESLARIKKGHKLKEVTQFYGFLRLQLFENSDQRGTSEELPLENAEGQLKIGASPGVSLRFQAESELNPDF